MEREAQAPVEFQNGNAYAYYASLLLFANSHFLFGESLIGERADQLTDETKRRKAPSSYVLNRKMSSEQENTCQAIHFRQTAWRKGRGGKTCHLQGALYIMGKGGTGHFFI